MLIFCLMLLSWITADLLWWWLAGRRLRTLKARRIWRILLGTFMGGQTGYMAYALVRTRVGGLPDVFPMASEIAVYIWHLVILPAALLGIGATTLIYWIVRIGRRLTSRQVARPPMHVEIENKTPSSRPTRRQLLNCAMAALPPLATIGVTGYEVNELRNFRIRRCEVALPSLPPDLDGLTIAHVNRSAHRAVSPRWYDQQGSRRDQCISRGSGGVHGGPKRHLCQKP